jgi:hypothetical protein
MPTVVLAVSWQLEILASDGLEMLLQRRSLKGTDKLMLTVLVVCGDGDFDSDRLVNS